MYFDSFCHLVRVLNDLDVFHRFCLRGSLNQWIALHADRLHSGILLSSTAP